MSHAEVSTEVRTPEMPQSLELTARDTDIVDDGRFGQLEFQQRRLNFQFPQDTGDIAGKVGPAEGNPQLDSGYVHRDLGHPEALLAPFRDL